MAVTDQQHPAAMSGQPVCPDPSVHQNNSQKRLQDKAAGAALYTTRPDRRSHEVNPLGPDGKLSSAGAATSLKYASAHDLPSFPSVGIDTKKSGLAAASLAASNPKNIEWWTPTLSENASKAALLAKDYKMAPLWQPGASEAGSKAAMLAVKQPGRDWWQPSATKDGQQAAGLAFKNKKLSPELDYGHTATGRNNSLLAAKLSVKGRNRAGSLPARPTSQRYNDPDYKANALKAATAAHEDGLQSAANEQSRITHARNLSREMYTEHPPIGPGHEEKAHQDALRASAISMAKKMYAIERVDDNGNVTINAGQAARTADAKSADGTPDVRKQAMQYIHLQEAAQRLAAERLAKIEDQHEAAAFRDYYGYGSQKRRSRLTLKGRNRRRASSESAAAQVTTGERSGRRNLDIDSDDEEQARKVRSQMSHFNAKLGEVDKKRDGDRRTLMAAAERKVQAQMSKMDEKVFNETGKMSPAMVEEWDSKARAKAMAASQMRMKNHGRVDIGGGKFLDQSEIDAIAAANVQPTLDQINETAEKQRARDEDVRLEKAEQKRQAALEKERNSETKALQKKMKAEAKENSRIKKMEEKAVTKTEHEDVKPQVAKKEDPLKHEVTKQEPWEDKSVTKDDGDLYLYKKEIPEKEKRSRLGKLLFNDKTKKEPGTISTGAMGTTAEPRDTIESASTANHDLEAEPEPTTASGGLGEPEPATTTSNDAEEPPSSPSKKRFSKILHKLKRSKKDREKSPERSFVGGTALTKQTHPDTTTTAAVVSPITAGEEEAASSSAHPRGRSPSISSLSSEEEEEEIRGRSATRLPVSDDSEGDEDDFEEARDRFDDSLVPPPTLLSKKTESPVRDSKFHEVL